MIPAARAMQERYRDLDMPTAIIAGAADKVVDVDRQSRRLHAELPGSTLRVVPGYGHVVHYQAIDTILDAVGEVMARVSERAI